MNKLFIILGILLLTSCSDKRKKILVGKWKLVNQSLTCTEPSQDSINATKRGVFLSPQTALKQQESTSVATSTPLVFNADGTFNDGGLSYKYELKDSGIIISFMNLVMSVYTINSLTDDKLIMTKGFSMKGHSHTYREDFQKIE